MDTLVDIMIELINSILIVLGTIAGAWWLYGREVRDRGAYIARVIQYIEQHEGIIKAWMAGFMHSTRLLVMRCI